jgi:hypothetical protein
MTARDTSREIHETARELKARGVNRDTATAVDETARSAMETAQTVSTLSEEPRHVGTKTRPQQQLQKHPKQQRNVRQMRQKKD